MKFSSAASVSRRLQMGVNWHWDGTYSFSRLD